MLTNHQPTDHHTNAEEGESRPLLTVAFASLGIVYGDIGTSPLYAIKEVFAGSHPIPLTHGNILGMMSLIFWSLMLVVSIKYVSFVMRADNRGEGGIMALIALVQRALPGQARPFMWLGLLGAALFYGDSVITPAISVISAVEGIEVITPALHAWIIPITLTILFVLFALQRRGTAYVGKLFAPIMLLWFCTLALLGIINIIQAPSIFAAISPTYAIAFFQVHPKLAFLSLGSVVLVITGAEALYADMGHLGRRPIQLAWMSFVLPSLILNYLGQGAELLTNPDAIVNPFYHLAPSWALIPLVALSSVATVIASQAVISGAYSITHQAIQLEYVPRILVQHTSSRERGQVYLPDVNWGIFLVVACLVLIFKSSTTLAAAYGIAVTGTMMIDTILVYAIARSLWKWNPITGGIVAIGFLVLDVSYFAANVVKIPDGGWFPLLFGLAAFTLMLTWKQGRELLRKRRDCDTIPMNDFARAITSSESIHNIQGTAVFLTPNPAQTPHTLLHSLKHYKSLHHKVIILQIIFTDEPFVPMYQRVTTEPIDERFHIVRVSFGFMDQPVLTKTLLYHCTEAIIPCNVNEITFFLGRETLIPKKKQEAKEMSYWRKKLFITMSRNADSPSSYFEIPANRVIELGTQIEL